MAEKPDLELKELGFYHGTTKYYRISPLFRTYVTDGIIYIMENGYSWFVTDALSIIERKLKNRDSFYSVNLVKEYYKGKSTWTMRITNGANKTYHIQRYTWSDAKRELKLFHMNGVLMLSGEY